MKKFYTILPIIAIFIITGCQANPAPLDPVSIQNTAVAIAWTSVAQTQAVDIISTVNAQGTQIAILSQPTATFTPSPSILEVSFALIPGKSYDNVNASYVIGYCTENIKEIIGDPHEMMSKGCQILTENKMVYSANEKHEYTYVPAEKVTYFCSIQLWDTQTFYAQWEILRQEYSNI